MSNTPLSPILSGKTTEGGGAVTPSALLSATASMTPEQKAEFRANVGATDAETSIPDDVKQALLDCFAHVAWVDDQGQTYYDELEAALYPLASISAVYTQSGTVYDTDSLDSLKADLVVTAVYESGNTETVPAANYTLSGTMTAGTSTITVFYGGKTATFDVSVTSVIYSLFNHTFNNADPINTELKPLENDRDISFAFDVDFLGQRTGGVVWQMFGCLNGSSPYDGIVVKRSSASNDSAYLQVFDGSSSGKVMIPSMTDAFVGNFKLIITHATGNTWKYYFKIANNSVQSGTVTKSFVSITAQFAIGGTKTASAVFHGTFNKCIVYPDVISDDRINAWMA